MYIQVLGCSGRRGFPQWNCNCGRIATACEKALFNAHARTAVIHGGPVKTGERWIPI